MAESSLRKPAVAGQFYPGSTKELKEAVKALIDKAAKKTDAIACMLPHAGYMYSGSVAGLTLSSVNVKEKIILLGPNHTGLGAPYSIMTEGTWQTPLGDVAVDRELAQKILSGSRYLQSDFGAHAYEHSLEVELPFLQYLKSDFKIVPITFSSDDAVILKEIGKEIARVLKALNLKDSTLVVASSDMTHYEPQESAQKKDKEALQAIIELNEDLLMEKINRFNISMCGFAPAIVMIALAKGLGAREAKLIKYQTSGDVTGDKTSVVGYAGLIVQ